MTAADTTSGTRARVYALASPVEIKQEEGAIERVFFQALGVTDRERYRVQVSETSGWIDFMDTQQLWGGAGAPNLPGDGDALKAAGAFLQSLAEGLSGFNPQLPERLRRIAMFPRLRPAELVKVAHPGGSYFDHWLYRSQPMLVLEAASWRQVPVFGSLVEVRIGDAGRIVGFCSRWRPHGEERISRGLTPAPGHGGGQHEHHGAGEPVPVYVLEGDRIPQYYLSPYYLTRDEHGLALASACDYSLTVQIGQVDNDAGTYLTALVDGGSRDYAFNWAVYSLDTVLDEGMRELGAGTPRLLKTPNGRVVASTVLLARGAYVALVNVKDRKTGAFKHHQQQVFSSPPAAEAGAAPGFAT
jgi:hypothetical protein